MSNYLDSVEDANELEEEYDADYYYDNMCCCCCEGMCHLPGGCEYEEDEDEDEDDE